MSDNNTELSVPATETSATPADLPTPKPADDIAAGAERKVPVEEIVKERRARRQAEKAAEEALAKVAEFENRNKTELERLTEAAAAAKAEAEAAKAESLRLRVAAETGLPSDLQEFLTGDSEDVLRERASKLLAATNAASEPRRPAPDPSQGAKPSSGAGDQLTRADLARMTPQQIVEAQEAGRFADLLAGRN